MAKLKVLPHLAIIDGFRGKVDFYIYHPTCDPENRGPGIPVARKWPRSPGHLRAQAVMDQWADFAYATQAWSLLDAEIQAAYRALSVGTGLSGRDLFSRSYLKGLFRYDHEFEEDMKLHLLDPEIELFEQYPIAGDIGWTDIDLTAHIIPAATHAYLRGSIQVNNAAAGVDWKLYIRPKDGTQEAIVCKWWGQRTPSFTQINDLFTAIGTDRKIQYKFDHGGGGQEVQVIIKLLGYIWI